MVSLRSKRRTSISVPAVKKTRAKKVAAAAVSVANDTGASATTTADVTAIAVSKTVAPKKGRNQKVAHQAAWDAAKHALSVSENPNYVAQQATNAAVAAVSGKGFPSCKKGYTRKVVKPKGACMAYPYSGRRKGVRTRCYKDGDYYYQNSDTHCPGGYKTYKSRKGDPAGLSRQARLMQLL